jgi:hypothetical protein
MMPETAWNVMLRWEASTGLGSPTFDGFIREVRKKIAPGFGDMDAELIRTNLSDERGAKPGGTTSDAVRPQAVC